jgi:hypothetical protein
MFYGRISDIYAGIITVALTLVLFTFFSATAGDEWVVGVARFGGFNGIFGQGRTGEEIANFQIPPVALWLPGMAAPYAVQDRARIRVLRRRELHLLRKGVADDELSEAVGHVRRFLRCYSACLDWSWM